MISIIQTELIIGYAHIQKADTFLDVVRVVVLSNGGKQAGVHNSITSFKKKNKP